MVTTTNKFLELVARGAEVGTWDTPTNANWSIVDNSFGGEATIPLSASNVVTSPAQYQCSFITFTGNLLAHIFVTFPAVGSTYTIQNRTNNAFLVVCGCGGDFICCPPYFPFDMIVTGGNARFKNLGGPIGTYEMYAGLTMPTWITSCSVPPYLNCDGSAISTVTYPVLSGLIGLFLPDMRGRIWASANQGTARLTTTYAGFDGDLLFVNGGLEYNILTTTTMPAHNHGVNDPGHAHTGTGTWAGGSAIGTFGGGGLFVGTSSIAITINANVTGISIQSNGSGGAHANVQPTIIGGIMMIRAG